MEAHQEAWSDSQRTRRLEAYPERLRGEDGRNNRLRQRQRMLEAEVSVLSSGKHRPEREIDLAGDLFFVLL